MNNRRGPSLGHNARGVLVVRSLEVFHLAVLDVPYAGCNVLDQIVVVRDQEERAFVALQRDVQRVN